MEEKHILQRIKFTGKDQAQYFKELRKAVNGYFKDNDISRNANGKMVRKSISILAIYIIPYFVILFAGLSPLYNWLLTLVMGFGMAGVGMMLMHDANHGSYSANPKVNKILGYSINLIGGNATNWKVQHNVLHHTFTNIDGFDGDLEGGAILRFSPNQKHMGIHKFQHIYAFFLYGFLTLSWSLPKDFIQMARFRKWGLREQDGKNKSLIFWGLVGSKLLYFAAIIGVPTLLFDFPLIHAVIGYVTMHFVCGFILSVVFQLAHVVGETEYLEPNSIGDLENSFAVHQMHTTANFATDSAFWTWYSGGLNFQVEHHMFPNICHIHYPEISKIVERVSKEYGVPYNNNDTFGSAVASHYRLLKVFGNGGGEALYAPEPAK